MTGPIHSAHWFGSPQESTELKQDKGSDRFLVFSRSFGTTSSLCARDRSVSPSTIGNTNATVTNPAFVGPSFYWARATMEIARFGQNIFGNDEAPSPSFRGKNWRRKLTIAASPTAGRRRFNWVSEPQECKTSRTGRAQHESYSSCCYWVLTQLADAWKCRKSRFFGVAMHGPQTGPLTQNGRSVRFVSQNGCFFNTWVTGLVLGLHVQFDKNRFFRRGMNELLVPQPGSPRKKKWAPQPWHVSLLWPPQPQPLPGVYPPQNVIPAITKASWNMNQPSVDPSHTRMRATHTLRLLA